jgi:hypothetical protein
MHREVSTGAGDRVVGADDDGGDWMTGQPRRLILACQQAEHTAVSAGVNVLALQRMLGHTSAKMTLDTYADLFDDDLDAVADTLHSRYSPENVGKMWARRGQTTPQQTAK